MSNRTSVGDYELLEMCFGGDCGRVMEATTENSVME